MLLCTQCSCFVLKYKDTHKLLGLLYNSSQTSNYSVLSSNRQAAAAIDNQSAASVYISCQSGTSVYSRSKSAACIYTHSKSAACIYTHSQLEAASISRIPPVRGLRTWADETHYSVLGIPHDATQKQIRSAYLKMSKELHPDHNIGKDENEKEKIHNKFVKINAAYSVLGHKKQRRLYDLEVLMQEDPRWRDTEEVQTGSPHMFRTKPMNFDERAQAMGFKKPDPNFYATHGNYHKKVVLWCMVFIAVGMLVQGAAIMALYTRHSAQLDLATANNRVLLVQARANARNYSTVQEQFDSLGLSQIEETQGPPSLQIDEKISV